MDFGFDVELCFNTVIQTIPECYTVSSDREDEYFRAKSTAKLNCEIREYRRFIGRADPMCGLVGGLRIENDKLSIIVSRRKSSQQREELCTTRIHTLQYEICSKFAFIQKCERHLHIFLDFREQAVWAAEIPNTEREWKDSLTSLQKHHASLKVLPGQTWRVDSQI